ncbi:MAG: hypothetical protein GX607_01440 [Myxococcales bacterium]|jgi:carbonic anhydrase|nr:hypothetical protein [Myxococcales bacterium]
MNTIDPHRLQELVRDPDQLLRQLGGDGVSFRTGPLPDPSEAASPRAVALCCSDMRELPERILGSAFGPISTLQSAGALLTPTMEASIRYALATTDARVLVVLGHLRCRLLEHCWAGRPRPFVLEDLLEPAFQEARRIPGGNLDDVVEVTARYNARRARDLAQSLRSSLGRDVAVVVAIYDDVEHRVTLSAADDGSRVPQPPLSAGGVDVQ